MRPVYITLPGASGNTVPVPLDTYQDPFNISLTVLIGAGTANVTVQYTFDDVFAPTFNPATAKWFAHSDLTSVSADKAASLIQPVAAVRMIRNSGTDPVTLIVRQAGAI